MIFKSFIFVYLFFSFTSLFAMEAKLEVNKTEININDYINLSLHISTTKGGAVEVSEIKGLDNFDIIGQSQSQSSSTKVAIINGKSKTEIETLLNLDLTLQAKTKGDFELGPAILKNNNEEIKSNIVKIKITGDKLFVNNNHLSLPTNTNSNSSVNQLTNNNINQTSSGENDDIKIDTYDDIEKKYFSNNKELYLLFGAIIFLLLGGYILLLNKNKILNKVKNNSFKKKQNNIIEEKEEEIDFEETKKDITYPELTDKDFIVKISDIFKQKLLKQYKIKDIFNKTFDEILQEIKHPKEDIPLLIKLINKAKYSNFITDNNKILSLVKKL